ncbi:phage tail terminator family protein [Sporomusa acidovorans]|uniref:Phage protein n=1 Tax=Sporomusa acidovorans (strain ATCC 49682 / DSM 3132 / Mol) TaxID=1123286 RepID=A0ABZ3J7T9_SPOA4|nr:hypothetical protein [Sporomusa acidovorans]OZC23811.1 hypothetical protein SPACI_04360 [Sporomusa acidovorans DSM 3132]SDF61864.1 hypothetical protein SAMN04488499_106316 [Sporomusa acidovorans]
MLNKVMDGIAQKLDQVFGEGYEIYIDEIKQGLKVPCFLILCLTSRQEQEIDITYNRELPFDVHYFPQAKKITREVNSTVDALNIGLEYIQIEDGLLRGTDMKHEVIDGVLHFFVNYDLRIRKVIEPDEYMETLTITERVKTSGN